MGDERGRAVAGAVLVPVCGASGPGADIGAAHQGGRRATQQTPARTADPRRFDVPGHADVLHHTQLHPAGRGHGHQLPGAPAGAVAGALDPESTREAVALRRGGHRLHRPARWARPA
ncbi:hypothetical protein G6F62_013981 [Rhizopus arrhizus]|nr:hypothetical protein G6F62_013981 [Rhizopus arrhizus]